MASGGHKTALAASGQQQTIDKQASETQKKKNEAFLCALQSAYFCAKEELPNRKYKALLDFLRYRGDKDAIYLHKAQNAKYNSPDIFNQLIGTAFPSFHLKLMTFDCLGIPSLCSGLAYLCYAMYLSDFA